MQLDVIEEHAFMHITIRTCLQFQLQDMGLAFVLNAGLVKRRVREHAWLRTRRFTNPVHCIHLAGQVECV